MIALGDTFTFAWGMLASTPTFGVIIIALLLVLVCRR